MLHQNPKSFKIHTDGIAQERQDFKAKLVEELHEWFDSIVRQSLLFVLIGSNHSCFKEIEVNLGGLIVR